MKKLTTGGTNKHIKMKADLYKVNSKLKKQLQKLVDEEIAKEFRKEAMYILTHCSEKTVFEFLFFALSDNGTLACTCLDWAKDKKGNYIRTKSFTNFKILNEI